MITVSEWINMVLEINICNFCNCISYYEEIKVIGMQPQYL